MKRPPNIVFVLAAANPEVARRLGLELDRWFEDVEREWRSINDT